MEPSRAVLCWGYKRKEARSKRPWRSISLGYGEVGRLCRLYPKHVVWVSLSRLTPLRQPDKSDSLTLPLSSSTSLMTSVWFSRRLASLLSFWRRLGFISAVCSLIKLADSWALLCFSPGGLSEPQLWPRHPSFTTPTQRSREGRVGAHEARRSQVDGACVRCGAVRRGGCTCAHSAGAALIFF